MTGNQILKFSEGFLWGSATSAYQVEGGIENNDWETSSRVPHPGIACDQYNHYVEDFTLAKKLGHNAHRFSLEWSRIEPHREHFDENQICHYREVLSTLKKSGLKTFVTLHHFTNPLWFVAQGGWERKENLLYFVEYVRNVAVHLGDLVDFWITINEPNIYTAQAYGQGVWPPHKRNILLAHRVYRNMLQAHNLAYNMIHAYYPEAKVGFAQNIGYYEPADPKNFFDRLLINFLDWYNVSFPYSRTRNDFLGVNHYFYGKLRFVLSPYQNFYQDATPRNLPRTDRFWPIYPRALEATLSKLKKFDKPVYITENGLADENDKFRTEYIKGYLRAVYRAMQKGVEVKGYLHWSLMDNFEWEDGYKWKFGLVKVDFTTQKRTVRKSAKVYAQICKENAIVILGG